MPPNLIILLGFLTTFTNGLQVNWKNCPDEGVFDCLEIDFGSGDKDLAILSDPKSTKCIWTGFLQGEDSKIVVTTSCPMEKYANLQISFWSYRKGN